MYCSDPYLFYTGNNRISVDYFHTPTQQGSNKFTDATYAFTTGEIVAPESFSIIDRSSPGKISYDVVGESGKSVNLDFAIVRLTAPDGIVLQLPGKSFMDDVSDYLDESLVSGSYEITVTQGNHIASQVFEYEK